MPQEIKSGFILINKPVGITSHDVVDYLRQITKIKKIGHSGTLDPLASGLLILGIGKESTKQLSYFLKLDKEYIARLRLGAVSSTFDQEGKIEVKENLKKVSKEEIENVLKDFVGKIKQIPPAFSAKKIKGKKLYELSRKGKFIKIKPIEVFIYQIKILSYRWPFLKIKVNCSSGTYLRSLANDIGEKLGCGAYLESLKRTKIGNYSLDKAQNLFEVNSNNWQKFLFNLSGMHKKA